MELSRKRFTDTRTNKSWFITSANRDWVYFEDMASGTKTKLPRDSFEQQVKNGRFRITGSIKKQKSTIHTDEYRHREARAKRGKRK